MCVSVTKFSTVEKVDKTQQSTHAHAQAKEREKKRETGRIIFLIFLIFSILIFSTLKKSIVLLFYCYMGLRPAQMEMIMNVLCTPLEHSLSLAITGHKILLLPYGDTIWCYHMVTVVTGGCPWAGEALANFSRKAAELK